MIPPRESAIEAAAVRYARDNGIWTRKFVAPATAGVPDRVFAKAGRVLWIEFKRPGNHPTALQTYEMGKMREAGLEVFVAHGVEEAKKILDEAFL